MAPSPLLTITIEAGGEIHLHAGGQGFWITRMLRVLGLDATICGTTGGETGTVIRAILESEGVAASWTVTSARNGAYVHDRRDGERREVADMPAVTLSRHDVDDLYGVALTIGLDADVCVLGGASNDEVVPADVYRRLAADLTRHGRIVVVDLAGAPLASALAGGVTLAKVSDDALLREGYLDIGENPVGVLERLRTDGARNVVMTRGDAPAIALLDGQREPVMIHAPSLHEVDSRGAGDSLTAGAAAALARGASVLDALRLGAAAGALNVTRHGLASGRRADIERMARHVVVSST